MMKGKYETSSTLASTPSGMLWPLVLFIIGFVFITLHQSSYFHAMPGDMGDARFNNVILEHLFRWITGKDKFLWSPPYFYPYPGVLAFSDNHFGTFIAYVLLRLTGLTPEAAFTGWYTFSIPLNFFCCYYVLRRLGITSRAAAVGAFIFTFSMDVSVQDGHAQLAYRFAVPLAVLALQDFIAGCAFKDLALAIFWVTVQFYCSIYLGYFLSLLLLAYVLAYFLVGKNVVQNHAVYGAPYVAINRSFKSASDREIWRLIAILAICFIALLGLFYPYAYYAHIYKFRRHYHEMSMMLPRLQSYLLADNSMIWGRWSSRIQGVPMRWEQQMFFGAAASMLSIFGILKVKGALRNITFAALVILVLFTLDVRGHSLYSFVHTLPLINAIRAVSRINLIMVFPVAVLGALGFDRLVSSNSRFKTAIAVGMVLLMVAEGVAFRSYDVPFKTLHERVNRLLSKTPSILSRGAIVYVPPGSDDEFSMENEIDGMRLSIALNRPVLNGYSGNAPNMFYLVKHPPCYVVNNRLSAYAHEAGLGYAKFADLVRRVVVVGHGSGCLPNSVMYHRTHFSGKVPLDVVKRMRIDVIGLHASHDRILATIGISNAASKNLSSISDDGHPIRISWRFVPVSVVAPPDTDWKPRKDLDGDIMVGKDYFTNISMVPPSKPGLYRVEVSLVQEGVLWFQDFGMPIGVSDSLIQVNKGRSNDIVLRSFRGRVPPGVIKHVRLDLLHPSVVRGSLLATLNIKNESSDYISFHSDEGHPIRVSWRFVPVGKEGSPDSGWDARMELDGGLVANGVYSADISMMPPAKPGLYKVEASMVQEGVLWFHDFGMPIGESSWLVKVSRSAPIAVVEKN
ncbi:hypothetical protein [Dyella sp. A6]|uniref:hypothetical protein n=1 Tax=Dyella aluminiiresistens TaxID=3069105 RepID=UPI002E77FCAD|nr:hypothetical protein [Dyella sp. A6]